MAFRISGSDFSDFVSSPSGKSADVEESGLKFITPKGDIYFKEHVLRDRLSIFEASYQMTDDVTISGKGESYLLELQFNLSDSDILFRDKSKASLVTSARSGNITFLPEDENQATILFNRDVAYSTFDIHLPFELLNQYAGESKSMDIFLENMQKGRNCRLAQERIAISPAIFHTIWDMKNCRFEGLSRRIYLESKVYELIALLCERIDKRQTAIGLSAGDQDRIREVAFLISNNIKKPFTILELARMAGMNQTKLKAGFKLIFGDTIFGYLQSIRMRRAKSYLLDTRLSIREIAQLVGYGNTSNFSIAFKKTYGYPPMVLRNPDIRF